MALVIKDAENRTQLLEMLVLKMPVLRSYLDQGAGVDILEQIINPAYFYQLELDDMLYGWAAITKDFKVVGAWLPEFEDSLPFCAGISFIIGRLMVRLGKRFSMLSPYQLNEVGDHLPTIVDDEGKVFIYPNPLISNVEYLQNETAS